MVKSALIAILAIIGLLQIVLAEDAAVKPKKDGQMMIDFDRRFNDLHYEIDYKLRVLRMDQSLAIKNLNAQFISRFGIVITDIQTQKLRIKDLILQHALEIGDTQNPCIVEKNDEAIWQATQSARDISVAAELSYADLATASRVFFYPQVQAFQNSSTELQMMVLREVSLENIVTGMDTMLDNLSYLYDENENKRERVIAGIEEELANFQEVVNTVRRNIWARSDEIARNFIYNMELLLQEALQCS